MSSSTAYRALVTDLTAKGILIAEVVAGLKELDPRRRQEVIDYVQQLLEEQRVAQRRVDHRVAKRALPPRTPEAPYIRELRTVTN